MAEFLCRASIQLSALLGFAVELVQNFSCVKFMAFLVVFFP